MVNSVFGPIQKPTYWHEKKNWSTNKQDPSMMQSKHKTKAPMLWLQRLGYLWKLNGENVSPFKFLWHPAAKDYNISYILQPDVFVFCNNKKHLLEDNRRIQQVGQILKFFWGQILNFILGTNCTISPYKQILIMHNRMSNFPLSKSSPACRRPHQKQYSFAYWPCSHLSTLIYTMDKLDNIRVWVFI